jgi:hypothetical protein
MIRFITVIDIDIMNDKNASLLNLICNYDKKYITVKEPPSKNAVTV